jgi:hypothetical protein
MHLNRFRGIKELKSNSDFIYADRFLSHALACNFCDYSKRDFLYRSGKWRGIENQVKLFEPRYESERTLLLGHSDTGTNLAHVVPYRLKGYKKIWAINATPFGSILKSLPLGLTNPTTESQMHPILGDTSHLSSADSETYFPTNFDGTVYGNFSITTNIRVRKPLADLLKKNGMVFSDPIFTERGRIEYLSALRRHSLTVCPEGNGVDTHRLWETIYMGGTPVIIYSKQIASLVRDLPVIVLKNWSELNDLAMLEEEWNQLNSRVFNFQKVMASFWISKFCNYPL